MKQQHNDRKPGDANHTQTDLPAGNDKTKSGAGGQTGGHLGETDRMKQQHSEPPSPNQGDLYSKEGEGKRIGAGTPGQDVNNRVTGTNPYTGTNKPETDQQKKAGKTGSGYGSEGHEEQSGTGKK